jgi:uncharacterized repeat protein (TIGR01451 family)
MKKTLLLLISLFFTFHIASAQCDSPTFPGVNNISQNAANIFWEDVTSTAEWRIELSYNGVIASQFDVSSNPYSLTDLPCGSNVTVTITSICSQNVMSTPITITFMTAPCNQPGQPQSFSACVDGPNQACFDLTLNDINLMGTLNPTEHVVTYHASNDDANNNINPLSSPYCVGLGVNHAVYCRVTNTTNMSSYISVFFLHVTGYTYNQAALTQMEQCDQDNNGSITFNLTSTAAQLNTSNVLTYYATQSDAENEQNPIINPTMFTAVVQPTTIPIYIRESIVNSCDTIYSFNLRTYANCNLASVCSLANSLCGTLGITFQNTINVPSTGTQGCLNTTPNPTWFYLPISNTGNINLMVQQSVDPNFSNSNLDVDYVVYGPFSDAVTPCNGQITANNIVSCSYSSSTTEYPVISNAIAGQYYLIMVTNFSNIAGYIRISDFGNSQGTIDCTGIRLNAFLDTNANGTQDNGENNFPLGQFQYEKNNNGTIHNVTSLTGVYNIYENNSSNSYDINYVIDPAYAAMYSLTTGSYSNVNITSGSGITIYNFPINIIQSYNDLAVTIIPFSSPRPGFTYSNKIIYANIGNQTIPSGTVTFNNDSNVTITNISQSGTNPTTTGFNYNFTNLLPFEHREITVTFQVPTIPTVNAEQYLTNTASIIPLTNDIVLENNNNSLSQMIINAYDPNDKMESHGEEILHSSFTSEDYLYYTIRFENTGNASAINVRINDVLDARLDENSIKMVSASHSYILDRVADNLTWKFNNIMLPVSIANSAIGKGYIMFKVKPKPGYAVNDIISNTASIYFDFNPAIITNTYTTTFVATLGTNTFENNQFIVYPNPTNDFVTIKSSNYNTIKSIIIYDMLGKVIISKDFNDSVIQTINTSELNSGIYLIDIVNKDNARTTKKLIIR